MMYPDAKSCEYQMLIPKAPTAILREVDSFLESRKSSTLDCVIALLVGVGLFVHFRIGVRLSLAELFLPVLLIPLAGKIGIVHRNKTLKRMLTFGFLACVSIVLIDGYLSIPLMSSLKNLARPLFALMFLIFFACLFSRGRTCLVFLFVGQCLGALIHAVYNTASDGEKFEEAGAGYEFVVFRLFPVFCNCLLIVCWYLYTKRLVWLVFALGAIATSLGILYSSRSSAAIIAIYTLFFMAIAIWPNVDYATIAKPRKALIKIGLMLICSGFIFLNCYLFLGRSGLLGVKAEQKLQTQTRGEWGDGVFGLLLGGRVDCVGLALMVVDSPIIGHGSASYRGHYYVQALELSRTEVSRAEYFRMANSMYDSGHSIVLGAWSSGGVLSAVFWIIAAYYCLIFCVILYGKRDPTLCLVLMPILGFLWDAAFSPLSVQQRAIAPMLVALYAVYLPDLQQYLSASGRLRAS